MYLHSVYTHKSLFLSLLAPQAIFLAFARHFGAILQSKTMISKGKKRKNNLKIFSDPNLKSPQNKGGGVFSKGFFSL